MQVQVQVKNSHVRPDCGNKHGAPRPENTIHKMYDIVYRVSSEPLIFSESFDLRVPHVRSPSLWGRTWGFADPLILSSGFDLGVPGCPMFVPPNSGGERGVLLIMFLITWFTGFPRSPELRGRTWGTRPGRPVDSLKFLSKIFQQLLLFAGHDIRFSGGDHMVIGERLRQLREEKNFSQGDIEKKTGLLRCYVSRVENGHTVPSLETLEKFASALEAPMYKLFYDGEKPAGLHLPKSKSSDEKLWGSRESGSQDAAPVP